MTGVFADTVYYLALLNASDGLHAKVVALTSTAPVPQVTTTWVLTEVLDAFSPIETRRWAAQFVRDLTADARVVVVPASPELFEAGLRHYEERPDKGWSLTACISFIVMEQRGLTDALSADHHFEQAGYRLMLKS
jgi:predicted nucleic acid-binding protein